LVGTGQKLQEKVLSYIQAQQLFYPGEKVVVAVSGGADSVCLLHLLHSIRTQLGIVLCLAHMDHGLRGDESASEAQYVARLASKLKINSNIESRDVSTYRIQKKLSLEEAARELRYAFFAEVVAREEAGCVTVAHSRDDNIETMLLHILRGTGISGLRGLQPRTVLRIGEERQVLNVMRPLLEVSRTEIEAYCREYKLRPRQDSSNLCTTFRRNRIRHELIPALKTYNPRIEEALLRLGAIADEHMAYIEEQSSQIWGDIIEEYGGTLSLDSKMLGHLPGVLQRQLLRWSVKYLCGDTRDLEAEHLEEMIKFLRKPSGKVLHLPHGLRLHRWHDHLLLRLEDTDICPLPPLKKEYSIKVPGTTSLPGWHIRTKILDKQPQNLEVGFTAHFDLEKTGLDLRLRARRRGDIFQPLGMRGPKKLQHFMSDARIPAAWRDSVPLVCAVENIIWVAGWRIADPCKITASTKKIINISLQRTE
jgi:tRNA(Ile)-lysidine synthase